MRKLDIRAVLGPITRSFYKQMGYFCPEIYGDPAILMPLIYKSSSNEKIYDVSIILHHSEDMEKVKEKYGNKYNFIDICTYDYRTFIDQITASKKVITSSLHGIILAESYGIPCVFYISGESVEGQLIKYYDWYFSTERRNVKYYKNLNEALKATPMELPNLEKMQEGLINSFPYDLWENEDKR